jgi:pyruvate/2-oxoglutarate dehydrogenase complex dihydrolipoamide acyltransferase (E2) component
MQNRKRGDRHDARRVRDLDSMHQFMPYVLTKRCDSEVYINEKVDVTEALKYINERNESDPDRKFTLFHLILAAFAKTIIHRPYLNRFISGRRYYERYEVSFSFVIKKQFSDKGEESLMILRSNGDSTLDQISQKVREAVHEVREAGGNDLDGILDFLVKFPRPVLRGFSALLNLLEYYNCMPKFLSDVDPYYTTVLIANLGSIKCGAPYHHLTEYGTNSVMVTVGEIHKDNLIDKDGNFHVRDVVEMGITIDERIGDGFYFAKSIKLFKHLLNNPALLEAPFKEEVKYDD